MFISKNKKEWENAIAKMFGLADRKLFFRTLKKLTKYNASKAALFTSSVTLDGVVVTDPAKVAEVVIRDVLLQDTESPVVPPLSLPQLENGELFYATSQLSVGKGMGPDWVPDSFFAKFIDQSNRNAKEELLSTLGKRPALMAQHFVSRVVLINKNKVGVPAAKDIRPITIQSPIQKLYELTLAQELKRLNGKTSPRQFGFKPHMSTSNPILGLYTFIRNLPTPARRCQGILLVDFDKPMTPSTEIGYIRHYMRPEWMLTPSIK